MTASPIPGRAARRALGATLVALGLALAVANAKAEPGAWHWPAPARVAERQGEPVRFPSSSPFTLAEVGTEAAEPTRAEGRLFLPDEASAAAPVPAVVLLHGAGGVLGSRELTYARQLSAMGVAALVIDVFAARRDRAIGFVDRLIQITESMILADAFAGLRYLDERPEVDGTRVVVIGFSYGGMAATYAAYAQVAERYAPEGRRFAGHVAFYAPCLAEFRDQRATGAPLLMLAGARDAIVDRVRCARMAEGLSSHGAQVEMVVYPEAYHQWDGFFSGPRPIGRDLSGCRLIVERDGTVRDAYTYLPMSGPTLRKIIIGLCADSEGYLIGRDARVRAKSNRALAGFLDRVFAPARDQDQAQKR